MRYIDKTLLFLYLLIVGIGLLNLYSISINNPWGINSPFFKQLLWFVISVSIGIGILFLKVRFWRLFSYLLFFSTIILSVLVGIFGKKIKGASAWINVGGLGIQPTEFLKFTTILALASSLSNPHLTLKKIKNAIIPLLIIFFPIGASLLQNDTGTAISFFSLMFLLIMRGLNPVPLGIGFMALISAIFTLAFESGIVLSLIFFLGFSLQALLGNYSKPEKIVISIIAITGGISLIFIPHLISFFITLCGLTILFGYGFFKVAPLRIWKQRIILSLFFIVATLGGWFSDFLYSSILKPHQRQRIDILFGAEEKIKDEVKRYEALLAFTSRDDSAYVHYLDAYNKAKTALKEFRSGPAYNVIQSRIAIGSGGLWGKGLFQGSQTKYKFVPQFFSDFAICNWAEETGLLGITILVGLFTGLLFRMIIIAQKHSHMYNKMFIYGVVLFIFTHFAINLGMATGILPTIGIPLPFISYGGSAFISFSLMIFVILHMEFSRKSLLF